MARTPLLSKLQSIGRLALRAEPGASYAEATAARESRRRFLREMTIGAAAVMTPAWVQGAPAKTSARIAIVGAGLAGLSCAYELKKRGIRATLFEASKRLGGRCSTNRSAFGDQYVEQGGEFINTSHREIRKLARELDLPLDDLEEIYETVGGEDLYYIDGAPYSEADAFADFSAIADQVRADAEAAPFPTTWDRYTSRGQALDRMSIADWIAAYVPGGMNSRLGRLLSIAYITEYGAEPHEQSALNLVYLLGYSPADEMALLGESDERYHVRGGNDRLVSRLQSKIGESQIKRQHELVRIRARGHGAYSLRFRTANGFDTIEAEHVVLALPFSILRRSVDYGDAGFDDRKRLAIEAMPMGNNSKLHEEFDKRYWREENSSGFSYSDNGYQSEWETTVSQPGRRGILTNYTGGRTAVAMNDAPPAVKAKQFAELLDAAIPGAKRHRTGRQLLNYWPGYRWTRGSYGYYAPGDYTRFVGYEGVRQGNCHFCGEHTSIESQGFLNGAVETGQRCAKEILDDVGAASEQAA